MTELLPRFITNREIDPLLGSTRTRERWEREGLLPAGELISGYRSAIKIFPDFAIARLAAPHSLEGSKTVERHLEQINRKLFRSPAFGELRTALKAVLRPRKRVDASRLVEALLPDHGESLQTFAAEVREADETLRQLEIYVDVFLVRISRCERTHYVVHLREGVEREISRDLTPRHCRFATGQWATLQDARFRGFRREFLLPTAVLDETAAAARTSLAASGSASALLHAALLDHPAPIGELGRTRRSISIAEEAHRGRIGVIDIEPVLSPVAKPTVSGLSYRKPAFG